jgi:YggT family protein
MTFVLATFRQELANYVYAVFVVYTLLIIAYILSSLFFAFGDRTHPWFVTP